jgi:hypothetical protein
MYCMAWHDVGFVNAGKPVNTLYVAKKMTLAREMYFAILLDRSTSGPIMIGCSEGGTSIEDLAEKFPEKIIKVPVNIEEGITDAQAKTMAEGLGVTQHMEDAMEQIKSLYNMFIDKDCTMVEVSAPCELHPCCAADTGVMSTTVCTCCSVRRSNTAQLLSELHVLLNRSSREKNISATHVTSATCMHRTSILFHNWFICVAAFCRYQPSTNATWNRKVAPHLINNFVGCSSHRKAVVQCFTRVAGPTSDKLTDTTPDQLQVL